MGAVFLVTMIIKNWKTASYVAITVGVMSFHLIGACWLFNEALGGYDI